MVAMSRLMDRSIERERVWDILGLEQETFTLQEIQEAAQRLGLTLVIKSLTLQELSPSGRATILLLKEPNQIITFLASGLTHALISENGMTRTIGLGDLSKHSTSEGLVSSMSGERQSRARWFANPVEVVDVPPETETVTESVKISNAGEKDLGLLAELPACGCAEIWPLQTRLQPGASVDVRVRIPVDHWFREWNSRLILVTFKCNDPTSPRISLGFQIKLSKKQ